MRKLARAKDDTTQLECKSLASESVAYFAGARHMQCVAMAHQDVIAFRYELIASLFITLSVCLCEETGIGMVIVASDCELMLTSPLRKVSHHLHQKLLGVQLLVTPLGRNC
jgi:hypothetical protein